MKIINWTPSKNDGVFLEVYLQNDERWGEKSDELLRNGIVYNPAGFDAPLCLVQDKVYVGWEDDGHMSFQTFKSVPLEGVSALRNINKAVLEHYCKQLALGFPCNDEFLNTLHSASMHHILGE